ncbi:MAG: hypothetical protein IJ387_07850 [Thermoguttaceae bacterium]|nr:hypothetical protein [Thermoguttaceae bacterium]
MSAPYEKGPRDVRRAPDSHAFGAGTIFSDENIDALTQFPQVRVLFVRRAPNAKITLDGVLKLKALKELRGVFAEECSTAEVDAFKAAQRELPRLGVVVTLADAPEHKKNVSLPPLQRDAQSPAR